MKVGRGVIEQNSDFEARVRNATDALTDLDHPMLGILERRHLRQLDRFRNYYLQRGKAREAFAVGLARKAYWLLVVHQEVTPDAQFVMTEPAALSATDIPGV